MRAAAVLPLPDVEVAVERVFAQPRRSDLWFAGEMTQTVWCTAPRISSFCDLLLTLIKSAQTLARPPISNHHIGAVGLGSSDRIFFGSNLEFPGLPLH
ncbi:hypothetical protein Tsubulata_027766 [Turnera subulata]|uniref:Uncharacterized protein n=1 Tax=Turnera subulata TaxID=218843 RepID=A0A9Q0GF58_9ROSI|nr:hypothetical protein Tsubulata_027766 [Turnera subulata]